MRPIKLTMTAFGPYKDIEVVDFTELESRNLFLITGPTGSGKTTIFDAISFAIYGEASGDLRTAESLRSQFSDDDLLTEVDLEFELKGIKYHIHRIPKQMRPRTKGEGFTEQKPTATLIIHDGEPKTVVTGVNKVNNKMETVIGINSEQFKQIMMIPQGEFQKLLTSSTEDRQRVLQKLFDTSIYNLIQMKLDNQAKGIYGEIKTSKDLRDYEISKIDRPENERLNELIESEDKLITEILSLTKEQIITDEKLKTDLNKEIDTLGKRIEKQIKEKQKSLENNNRIQLRIETQNKLTEKELLNKSMAILDQKQKRAQKALVIAAIEDNYTLRKKEFEEKSVAFEATKVKKKQAEIEFKASEKLFLEENTPEMAEMRKRHIEHLSILRSYEEKVKKIEDVTLKITETEKLINDIEKDKESNADFLTRSKKSIDELRIKRDSAKDSEVKVGIIRESLKNANEIQDKLEKIKSVQGNLIKTDETLETQRKALDELNSEKNKNTDTFKKAKMDFYLNQAALLAKDLKEGDSCPVCGSTQHPLLAVLSKNIVTEDTLEALEVTVKKSEDDFNSKKNEINILSEKRSQMEENYNEIIKELSKMTDEILVENSTSKLDAIILENKAKINQLTAEKANLELLAAAYESIGKEIDLLNIAVESAEAKKSDLNLRFIETSNALSKKQSELESIYADVPEKLRNSNSLDEAIKYQNALRVETNERFEIARNKYEENKELLVALEASEIELKKNVAATDLAMKNAKHSLDEKIQSSDFTSIDDYRNSILSQSLIDDYKARIENHSKELHSLKQQVEKLILETKDFEITDLSVFDEKIQLFKDESNILNDKLGRSKSRIVNNTAIISTVETINADIGSKEATYKIIGNLASVAKGNNKSRVTFERYVLAAFLEDIIAAANIRLKQMTGGRYRLSRTEELQRSNAKGGLELEVYDEFTGKSRHVKTLSGGEGFKASLSMALGLADVVQSYAGGVQLDTMFIDEGFGTLDQESLDGAISCLIDLQKTGRLVGIISHVQELKERIDTRLEVNSSNVGSTTQFIIG